MRAQRDVGLDRGDPWCGRDLTTHGVQLCVGSAFHQNDQIRGTCDRPAGDHVRDTREMRDDMVAVAALLECNRDKRLDVMPFQFGAEPNSVTGDHTSGLESPDALMHSAAR